MALHPYLDLDKVYSSSSTSDDEYSPEYSEGSLSCCDEHEERWIPTLRSKSSTTTIESIEPENTPIEKKIKTTKKRQLNSPGWQRNITKKKVNRKEGHVTSTFRLVNDSNVCGQCSCNFQCSIRVDEDEQKTIHDTFAGLGDRYKQILWVNQNSTTVDPKYRYPNGDIASARKCNRKYFLPVDDAQVRVCKIFFMNTLNVGDTFLRNAFKNFDETTGQITKDGRGKHNNRNKVSEEQKEEVRNHINSFRRIESHYLRAQTTREFLEGSLDLVSMYRLYAADMASKNKTPVKLHTYRNIFNNEFNISFFKPKKDRCDLCYSWEQTDESERSSNTELKRRYDNHIKNKMLSRKEKENDISLGKILQNETIVGCYDLQAIMQSPCGEISSFYYKSKLNCYNFTIFDSSNNAGHCYFWNEAISFKGANEVSTFVYFFLKHHEKKNFIFYSDNCIAQNKNKAIVAMYFYAVKHLGIEKITHKYLTKGHTQNKADNIHSAIEKNKKRFLKTNIIYVPADWIGIIKTARGEGSPYFVHEANSNGPEILDFKSFASHFNCKNLPFLNMKVLEVRKNDERVHFKCEYDEEEFRSTTITKRNVNYETTHPKVADFKTSISNSKKKDLLDMCNAGLIPQIHHQFYKNLVTCPNVELEDDCDITMMDIEFDDEF